MSGGQDEAAEMINEPRRRMTLTAEQKAVRSRERMLEKAKCYQIGTYAGQVAKVFQKMIRAEAAAQPAGELVAIVGCEEGLIFRRVGECVCVTCGKVLPWKGSEVSHELDTGHFLASRRLSILLEEDNVAPQCVFCNRHRSGEQQLFRKWMIAVRGMETVERLERLKNTTVQFTREQLVDMRIAYAARLKSAEQLLSPRAAGGGE